MIRNTAALPTQAWSQAQNAIMQVRSLSNASSLLSGNAGGILGRLNSATGYAGQLSNVAALPSMISGWQQQYGTATSNWARQLGLQESQQQSDAAVLARLQAQAANADGQKAALDASNQLATFTSNQLMSLHAAIIASNEYAAQRDLIAADRRAREDNAWLQSLSDPPPPLHGYGSYSW